jgi:hypothetical protein
LEHVDGLLPDKDGLLGVSWTPQPGAAEAVTRPREALPAPPREALPAPPREALPAALPGLRPSPRLARPPIPRCRSVSSPLSFRPQAVSSKL